MKKNENHFLWIIIYILLSIVFLFLGILIGIKSKNKYGENGYSNVTRTILIYMVGADLESEGGLASSDLEKIVPNPEFLKDNNIVLMAGGSKKWDNNYINANETSIFEMTSSGFNKVKKNNVKNMGNSKTLIEFLNYVYSNYKTDQYDLIFWNHGGAIDGNEYDELNKNDNLSLKEIKQSFDGSPFSNKKFEMVIFRTCLNGTIEYANLLKNYSEYMVASEESTVGASGYSPLTFINKITKESSSVDIGKSMIDDYVGTVSKICGFFKNCTNVTYSMINLRNIDYLKSTMDDFFKDLKRKVNTDFADISKVRGNMTQYDSDSVIFEMVDLYQLVDNYKNYSTSSNQLKQAIKKSVVYNYSNNDYSYGLSIYFPYYTNQFGKIYDEISASSSYSEFLNEFNNEKKNTKTPIFSFGAISKSNINEIGSDFELELTDDQVKNYNNAKALVLLKNSDGSYKPLFNTRDIQLDGNILKTTIRGKSLKVTDSSNDSGWMSLNEISHNDDEYKYETYAYLENINGESVVDYVKLIIQVDNENPNGKIISSIMRGDSNTIDGVELPNVISKNYKDYDNIAFASSSYYLEFNEDGTYKGLGKSNGVIEGKEYKMNDFKFVKEQFDKENEYYAVFIINDVVGNQYTSNLIKIN